MLKYGAASIRCSPFFSKREFNMAFIYKYIMPSIVFCAAILFSVSVYAGANAGLKVNSPFQTKCAVKAKSKSRIKMSDSIIGAWSGNHVSLEITKNGAEIEYDCATGSIGKKIILDKANRFDVSGTYAEEHGGPVRFGEQSNGYPVRYSGQVKGKKMILTVKRKDNNKTIGTFTLFYGRESTLVKCR